MCENNDFCLYQIFVPFVQDACQGLKKQIFGKGSIYLEPTHIGLIFQISIRVWLYYLVEMWIKSRKMQQTRRFLSYIKFLLHFCRTICNGHGNKFFKMGSVYLEPAHIWWTFQISIMVWLCYLVEMWIKSWKMQQTRLFLSYFQLLFNLRSTIDKGYGNKFLKRGSIYLDPAHIWWIF